MSKFHVCLPGLAIALIGSVSAQAVVGSTFCSAIPNSTGATTTITGFYGNGIGSSLHLEVTHGVPNEFGYFLVGNEITPGVMLSAGQLCLIGTPTAKLYRYNVSAGGANSIGQFDSFGVMQNLAGTSQTGSGFDVPDILPGSVPISITSGGSWNFQFWHRDTPRGPGVSTLSSGLSTSFLPPPTRPGHDSHPAGKLYHGNQWADRLPYRSTAPS